MNFKRISSEVISTFKFFILQIGRERNMQYKKKSILFFVWGFPVGGAERILNLITSYLNDDFNFFFISTVDFIDSANAWKSKFEKFSSGIFYLPQIFRINNGATFILNLIHKNNIQTVCVYNSLHGYQVLRDIKRKYPHIKTLSMLHTEFMNRENSGSLLYEKFIDYYISVSERVSKITADSFNVPVEKIITIRNGVDFKNTFNPNTQKNFKICEELGLPCDKKIVLWLGRFSEEKRPLDFIAIARLLYKKDLFFAMFGDGPLKKRALDSAVNLNNFKIYDSIDDIPALLSKTYVLILTSSSEATPLVVLEALGMNVPVVSTRVGEVEKMIVDGENGYIVEVGEIQRIGELIEKVGVLKKSTIRSRVVESFSMDLMIEKYKNIF